MRPAPMKTLLKTLFAALTLAAAATAAGADPRLLGTWRSDREASLAFASGHSGLEDRTRQFLEQLLGHLTLSFDPQHLTSHLADVPVRSATGVVSTLAGFSERHPYRVLSATRREVTVSTVDPVSGQPEVVVFHGENGDALWVELPSPPMPVTGLREYFVRVR